MAAVDPGAAAEGGDDDDALDAVPVDGPGAGRHWLTSILIYLVVWGGGFLVGVLVDRIVAG